MTPIFRHRAACLLLVGITLAAFGGVKDCGFINFDDPMYVYANPEIREGLTWHGLQWAFGADLFFNSPFVDYWQPVTCLSRLFDVQLFGLNPAGHHLMNLFIHILNTLLLFHLLRKMTCPEQGRGTGFTGRSFMVAALFAVHPLRVEAVAWVTERKELLGGTFWMLTLWAYWKYSSGRRRPVPLKLSSEGGNPAKAHRTSNVPAFGEASPLWGGERRACLCWYSLTLLFFILGLMSKPMIITLPLVLLLLDYWPLRRFQMRSAECGVRNAECETRNLFGEKLPFLTLSLLSILITLKTQSSPLQYSSLLEAFAKASISYGFYLVKTFFPFPLAVFYTRPSEEHAFAAFALSLVLLAIPTLLALWRVKSRPWLFTGWFWFLATLGPVVGLNDMVGADRFTYLPLVGLFILMVWELAEWETAWKWKTEFLNLGSGLLIGSCVMASASQVKYWHSTLDLFQHAAEVSPDGYFPQGVLGDTLVNLGRADKSLPHLRMAALIDPESSKIQNLLGKALVQEGKTPAAMEHFKAIIRKDPAFADAWLNLGDALVSMGKTHEGIAHYVQCLKLDPDNFRAENNLGLAFGSQGEWDDAIRHFLKALQINPAYAKAHYNLAISLRHKKKFEEARDHLKIALQLDPGMKEAQTALAKNK